MRAENGHELWIVVRGNPVEGFTYSGPYESKSTAESLENTTEWREDGDGGGAWEPEPNVWVVPMRYREGFHIGALKIDL